MSKRYRKSSSPLWLMLLLLALVTVMIFPTFSSLFDVAGGGDTPPVITPETPGTENPGTDDPSPDDGGSTGGDNTGDNGNTEGGSTGGGTTTPDDGNGDTTVEVVDAFGYASGRMDAAGNCLHTRYVYTSQQDNSGLTGTTYVCYMAIACERCGSNNTATDNTFHAPVSYYRHHYDSTYTCTLCQYTCPHKDDNADGICDYGCGSGCSSHTWTPGTMDDGNYELYFYNSVNYADYYNGTAREANACQVCTVCSKRCYHENVSVTYTGNASTGYCMFKEICMDCGYVFGECNTDHKWQNGACANCKTSCTHTYVDSICTKCGQTMHVHSWSSGTCTSCGATCVHKFDNGTCTFCGSTCVHTFDSGICTKCSYIHTDHSYQFGSCILCGYTHTSHTYEGGICTICGYVHEGHEWIDGDNPSNGICLICGYVCPHFWENGFCPACALQCNHTWSDGACSVCGTACEHTYGICHLGCINCGYNGMQHDFVDSQCMICTWTCPHEDATYAYTNTDGTYTATITCDYCGFEQTEENAEKTLWIVGEGNGQSVSMTYLAGMTWADLYNSSYNVADLYIYASDPAADTPIFLYNDMGWSGYGEASGLNIYDAAGKQVVGADYIQVGYTYTVYKK